MREGELTMKISIINGSPKSGKSTSELMIKYLIPKICNNNEVEVYNIFKGSLTDSQLTNVKDSNVLIFTFPLYIDSIPAHLLRILIELDKGNKFKKDTMIYCIVNNGFFEGKQNHIAVEQIKNWCMSAKITWGQAIGIGAGEMLPFFKDIPLGHGPNKNIGNAINSLALNVLGKKSEKDIFISPNWSRILWKIQASLLVWYPRAIKNGLKSRDLKRLK